MSRIDPLTTLILTLYVAAMLGFAFGCARMFTPQAPAPVVPPLTGSVDGPERASSTASRDHVRSSLTVPPDGAATGPTHVPTAEGSAGARSPQSSEPAVAGKRSKARPVGAHDGDPSAAQWAALRACESSGNYRVVSSNGLWHGAYQFTVGTWQGVGGSGLPELASRAEQDLRALLLWRDRGWSPWPVCGASL
jgi:peptidoglycan endopeptidase LytE